MQRAGALLYGFEKDVNRLIDEYALQAELEQSYSFHSFKQLFIAGGYAYLHQAYPGCEHSTEYTQLLFATALDRLDIYSPTAPPESPLWLHHVGKACAAAAAAGMARGAAEKAAAKAAAAAAAETCSQAAAPVAADAANSGQHGVLLQQAIAAAEAVKKPVASVHQCNLHHTYSQDSLAANNMPGDSSYSTGMLAPLQQQQQWCSNPLQQQQQQQQQWCSNPLQQQQQQQQQWCSNPLQQEQQPAGQLPCSHPLQQLLVQSPVLQDQQQWQSPALDAQLPTDMQQLPQQAQLQQQAPAQPTQDQQAMRMQSMQQQQQQCQVPEWLKQHQQVPVQPLPHQLQQSGQLPQQQAQGQTLQQQLQQEARLLHNQEVLCLPGQQQQQFEVMPCKPTPPDEAAAALDILADEMSSDDFLNDLLAIFEEAEEPPQDNAGAALQQEQLHGKQPADEGTATAVSATAQQQGEDPAPQATAAQLKEVAPGQHRPRQQWQYTPPPMYVPLAVKAAVVFTLYCLYETQLSLPKVCIYTSLEHLKELKTAAADFSAAGPAAADVLAVLQVLIKQDRLLIGQFRRPVQWKPQLPRWLAPPPKWPDLGLGSLAANRAAARVGGSAGDAARVEAVKSAANIVRSLRDHKPNEVDHIVHRDAMFHIKTALRSLANFKGLQALCSKYASARRAIFEPLLRIQDTGAQQELAMQAGNTKQQQSSTKRASMPMPPASKRSRLSSADVSGEAAARQAHAGAAAARQQAAAASAATAAAVGVPELFDCNFGSALAHLADGEATNMLMVLDPAKNPHQAKRRLKQQAEAAKQAAAAAAGNSSAELHQLARGTKQQQKCSGKPGGTQKGLDAGLGQAKYVKELFDAGVISPMELQDLEDETLESQGSVTGFGAAGQVLQRRQQQRQHTLAMAEQWFRSHDAMIQLGDLDDGEDMP